MRSMWKSLGRMRSRSEKRVAVRFKEREYMLLRELSERRRVSLSVVVRALISHALDELMDADGNWKD